MTRDTIDRLEEFAVAATVDVNELIDKATVRRRRRTAAAAIAVGAIVVTTALAFPGLRQSARPVIDSAGSEADSVREPELIIRDLPNGVTLAAPADWPDRYTRPYCVSFGTSPAVAWGIDDLRGSQESHVGMCLPGASEADGIIVLYPVDRPLDGYAPSEIDGWAVRDPGPDRIGFDYHSNCHHATVLFTPGTSFAVRARILATIGTATSACPE